uniref:Ras family GTPase n=1 Tax=Pithovirus LCPAC101 TaxID=2506586 RepID=A0A481Z620_9VIRU|nr:MAG: Ras family GTPase [Pithovirus LCPAC101]
MDTFKVILSGDGGVGKTTLIKRHLTGNFEKRYIATLGVEVHPLKFNTNYGNICLNIWDCAGIEKFGGLRDGYFRGAQALIIMFDLTSLTTFKNVTKWISLYRGVAPNTPIVLCGSKCDVESIRVTPQMIQEFIHKLNIPYFVISSKSNYNFLKPFLEVCKRLKSKDLRFK